MELIDFMEKKKKNQMNKMNQKKVRGKCEVDIKDLFRKIFLYLGREEMNNVLGVHRYIIYDNLLVGKTSTMWRHTVHK